MLLELTVPRTHQVMSTGMAIHFILSTIVVRDNPVQVLA